MIDGVPPTSVAALTSFLGTNPAANAEISEVVPAGQYWRLIAISVALVQGITQTPQPVLQIDDGTNVVFEGFGSSAAQAVSTTCRYTWGAGHPLTGQIGATTNVRSTGPMPADLLLGPGYRIKTVTVGIGANTDYGAPQLLYVKYS